MVKAVIKFGDTEIEKQNFHQHKRPISMKSIDINKKVSSNKVPFGQKRFNYFIGYKDAKKVRPLCIFLPKTSACRRYFDKTKYMSSLIKDDELLKKYNYIWEKVKNSVKKEFDNETVYNEKYKKLNQIL